MQINESILTYNLTLFAKRFPELVSMMGLDSYDKVKKIMQKAPQSYSMLPCAKNKKAFTLCIDGKYLHSKYDAESEAKQIVKNSFFQKASVQKNCVFVGLGLGYIVEAFMAEQKTSKLIIVEADIFIFLFFLNSRKLDSFFSYENIVLLIGLSAPEVLNILYSFEKEKNIENLDLFFLRTSEIALPAWYDEFKTLQKRNDAKKQINYNTAKKFFKLWFKNLLRNFLISNEKNIYSLESLISIFKNKTAVIFAAGPSLERDLEILSKINLSQIITIAVDTASRAVLASGIRLDFVISADPQYANFKHLANLDLSESILVAELSSFPQTFELKTRAKYFFSQDLPLEKLFFDEAKKLKNNICIYSLDSGGSVATSAFSFAKFLSVKNIYFSGLDLAYVDKQSHFRGSIFEEACHTYSTKLNPAQTQLLKTVFNSESFFAASNTPDKKVLSDSKMQMFAWYFESKLAEYAKDICVYTFSDRGLHIPGIKVKNINDAKNLFFTNNNENCIRVELNRAVEKSKRFLFPKKSLLLITKKVLDKMSKNDKTVRELFSTKDSELEKLIEDCRNKLYEVM